MKKLVLLVAFVPVLAMAHDRVSKFDKNEDRVVDLQELRLNCEINEQLFNLADKDGNGVLTNVEMRVAKSYLFKTCRKEKKD